MISKNGIRAALSIAVGIVAAIGSLTSPLGVCYAAQTDGAAHAAALARIKELGGIVRADEGGRVYQVDLSSTKVADADLAHIAAIPGVTELHLSRTGITDAGLKHLAGLKDLTVLDLYQTVVTDAGMKQISGLTNLKFLLLKRTNVSKAGAQELERLLPECLVSRSPLNPWPEEIGHVMGRWKVQFANGVEQVCEIRDNGTASVTEPKRTSEGKVGKPGEVIVIVYDDERVERWTIVGKRAVVEHWATWRGSEFERYEGYPPYRPLPTSAPVLGIAERAE